MYGATIGYFMVSDPKAAKDIYAKKLAYLWDADKNAWKETLSYYDDNWAWFGIALYNNLLPNLAATLPPSALSKQFQ
jgi:endoglucanase